MYCKNLFETFNVDGKLLLPDATVTFKDIPWSKHPTFEGVELKHIVVSKQTNGQFSYHLVKIAPHKKIGNHVHQEQLETHEIIFGNGTCITARNLHTSRASFPFFQLVYLTKCLPGPMAFIFLPNLFQHFADF